MIHALVVGLSASCGADVLDYVIRLVEIMSMNKLLLPVTGMLVAGAFAVGVNAADSEAGTQRYSEQEIRAQLDKKREQISGADKVAKPTEKAQAGFIDTPVNTDDAPSQEARP